MREKLYLQEPEAQKPKTRTEAIAKIMCLAMKEMDNRTWFLFLNPGIDYPGELYLKTHKPYEDEDKEEKYWGLVCEWEEATKTLGWVKIRPLSKEEFSQVQARQEFGWWKDGRLEIREEEYRLIQGNNFLDEKFLGEKRS